MGEIRNPSDPVSQGLVSEKKLLFDGLDNEADITSSAPSFVKSFRFRVSANDKGGAHDHPLWNAILWDGRLYVNVTSQQLSDGSKAAFVSLLEYAEERLGCSHVIICLDKNITSIKAVLRNFLFLGFQALTPGHEFQPKNPNLVCFVYTI